MAKIIDDFYMPMLYNSSDEDEDIEYLHKNLISNSERQNSSQGSVFYVKLNK
jgi:hypothetical protein